MIKVNMSRRQFQLLLLLNRRRRFYFDKSRSQLLFPKLPIYFYEIKLQFRKFMVSTEIFLYY